MFLDEPTTGLDAFMSAQVVGALRALADCGHTVVVTIHQPRSSVFAAFDDLLLVSVGRVVYHGPAADVLAHFAALGHACPEHYNPAGESEGGGEEWEEEEGGVGRGGRATRRYGRGEEGNGTHHPAPTNLPIHSSPTPSTPPPLHHHSTTPTTSTTRLPRRPHRRRPLVARGRGGDARARRGALRPRTAAPFLAHRTAAIAASLLSLLTPLSSSPHPYNLPPHTHTTAGARRRVGRAHRRRRQRRPRGAHAAHRERRRRRRARAERAARLVVQVSDARAPAWRLPAWLLPVLSQTRPLPCVL